MSDLKFKHVYGEKYTGAGGVFTAYRGSIPVAKLSWHPDDHFEANRSEFGVPDEDDETRAAHVCGVWAEKGHQTGDGVACIHAFKQWLKDNHDFTHVTHMPISQVGYASMRHVFGEPSHVWEDGAGPYHRPKDRLEAIKVLPRVADVVKRKGLLPRLDGDSSAPNFTVTHLLKSGESVIIVWTLNKNTQWKGRPVADAAAVPDLDVSAAVHQFGGGVTRDEAEERAYGEYRKRQATEAAAHHLRLYRAATSAGDREVANRHKLMYDVHVRTLGENPAGQPPQQVKALVGDGAEPATRFKPHPADSLPLTKVGVEEMVQQFDFTRR